MRLYVTYSFTTATGHGAGRTELVNAVEPTTMVEILELERAICANNPTFTGCFLTWWKQLDG